MLDIDIVDVNASLIHQMWAPADDAYSERSEVRFGDRIHATTIEGVAVETDGLD